MRICPAQAIRVHNRKAVLLRDLCIDCGECVRVCPSEAIVPQTSPTAVFAQFKRTIALPSPVFYSQFGKDVSPAAVLNALGKIGFDEVFDVAHVSEAVSNAIQAYLDEGSPIRPLISPFCPAIVRLIQVRYPNLLNHLIPIESPMEIAAREAKHRAMCEHGLKENEIGVIYITPCPAKVLAIKHPPRKRHSFVDGTIAISEIYPTVLRAISEGGPTSGGKEEIRGLGLGWPILGGQLACLQAQDCLAIGGLNDAVRIFEEVENGKLRDIRYIEVHSCPTACVGGLLTVENAYIARGRVLQLVQKYGGEPWEDREKIKALYRKDYFALPGKIPSSPIHPLDADVSKALQKLHERQEIYERLPKIDCGSCGSPTCMAFADDVVKREASADACVFLSLKHLETLSAALLSAIRSQTQREGHVSGGAGP